MLQDKLKILPHKPGCYLMFNQDQTIIYVGKAKDLYKRVNSYFNRPHDGKTGVLINNIVDFEYIVTDTEREALILELNLIKKHNPKYNILLKDDKSYPYIEITNEKFPRLQITRPRKIKKQMQLFGPYPNAYAAKETLDLLNRIYPLRKCQKMPKKLCLYYHIGQCLGYCEYPKQIEAITEIKKEIVTFLNGDPSLITKKINETMHAAAKELNFEKALELKELLNNITLTVSRQKIVLKDKINRDVLGYAVMEDMLSVQIFHIRNGNLVARDAHFVPLIDDLNEYLVSFLLAFYEENNLLPKELLVPSFINEDILKELLNIKIIKPIKGIKKEVVDLANKNALQSLDDYFKLNQEQVKNVEILNNLCQLINIKGASRIELFDNSHLFGTYKVGAMVTFIDGKPSKNDYRKFNIKSIVKDDYHMMQEVIYRRYFRVLKDNLANPDLIIVDGGIIQINAAKAILNDLQIATPVFGLVKDDKHQTSALTDGINNYDISNNQEVFNLLVRMQNEVHRFAINFHKEIRSKGNLSSIFDDIKGLGPKNKELLLSKYNDLKALKEVDIEELKTTFGNNLGENIYHKIHKQ